MNSNVDKIIQTLYLAVSDTREKMLSSLILNVIFNYKEGINEKGIISVIQSEFFLTIVEFELQESLEKLVASKKLSFNDNKYFLTVATRRKVIASKIKNKEITETRKKSFEVWVKELSEKTLKYGESNILWNEFNNYLYNCFLIDGRKSIDSFLSYNENEERFYRNVYNVSIKNLKSTKLRKVFKAIILDYPYKINSTELNYLNDLALKAERFFSLGVEEELFKKTQNLHFEKVVILADTNVLYSVLDIRHNPENNAIHQLVDVTSKGKVGIRLAYLKNTHRELNTVRNQIENSIPQRTEFTRTHIKALLASNDLDLFSRRYYEKRLQDSETPHPIHIVENSINILKSRGINIYNHQFPNLEKEAYIENRKKEYFEFESNTNRNRAKYGLPPKTKSDRQLEHDIYLREAIISLKSKYSNEEDIKFSCITLDNNLINFDRYVINSPNNRRTDVIIPNFILPSVFLRKLRAFLPIKTDDYKKAFLSTITSNIIEGGTFDNSIALQKSMSYFKKLGIDDEKTIISIIKNELFIKEYKESERNHSEEKFIRSKIDVYIKSLEEDKKNLLQEKNEEVTAIKIEKKILENKSFDDKQKLVREKNEVLKELSKNKENLNLKEKELEKTKRVVNDLNGKVKLLDSSKKTIEELENKVERTESEIRDLRRKFDLEEFCEKKWIKYKENICIGGKKLLKTIVIITIPVILAVIVKVYETELELIITKQGLVISYFIIAIFTIMSITYRSILLDKIATKNAFIYFTTLNKKRLKHLKYQEFKKDFDA